MGMTVKEANERRMQDLTCLAQTIVRMRRPPEEELVAAIDRAVADIRPLVHMTELERLTVTRELYIRFSIA